jgi:hypothetical protein
VFGCNQQPLVCHHTQISVPVHKEITYENSTTMSLYEYDLIQQVVETSLGGPTGGADYVEA